MSGSRLRLGFIGVGSMGQCAHLQNYAALPDCELVALAELRPELAQLVAQRYGIAHVYTDYRKMLAEQQLDGIVCIQPFTIHGQILPDLLKSNIPTLIEKPLACSVAAAERIMQSVVKSKAPLYVAYNRRSDPAVMHARQQIDQWRQSGEVGNLRYLRITISSGDWIAGGMSHLLTTDEPYPAVTEDDPGLPAEDVEPMKRLANFPVHPINLLRHLHGEKLRVTYADPARMLMVLETESGLTNVIEMSAYRTTRGWDEDVMVCFDRGWIKMQLPAALVVNQAGHVSVYSDPGEGTTPTTLTPTLPPVHPMRQQAVHFLAALRGEPTPLCLADEALEDLRVAQQYLELFKQTTAD